MADALGVKLRLWVTDAESGPRINLDIVPESAAGVEESEWYDDGSDFNAFGHTIARATWLLRLRARQGDREWLTWETTTYEDSTLSEESLSLSLWLAPGAAPTSYEVDFELHFDPRGGPRQVARFSGGVASAELEPGAPSRGNEGAEVALRVTRRMAARAELDGPPFVVGPGACQALEGVVAFPWAAPHWPGPSGLLAALPEIGRLHESGPGGALHIYEREKIRMFATSFEALAQRANLPLDPRILPSCIGGARGRVAIFWPLPLEQGQGSGHCTDITVFSTNDGALLARHRQPTSLFDQSAMFDASGRWFFFEGRGGPFLVDLEAGSLRSLTGMPGLTSTVLERATQFDSESVWFAGNGAVGRYDFASSSWARMGDLPSCWGEPPYEVSPPAFHPALRRVAAPATSRGHDGGSYCSGVRVYDPRAGLTTFDFGCVYEVQMLDDGRVVVAGGTMLWLVDPDAPPGRQLYEIGPYTSAPTLPLRLKRGTPAMHVSRHGDRQRLWLGSERAWCVEFPAKAAVLPATPLRLGGRPG